MRSVKEDCRDAGPPKPDDPNLTLEVLHKQLDVTSRLDIDFC